MGIDPVTSNIIFTHLDHIKELFKPGAKSTLIIRNPKFPKSDVLVSDEADLEDIKIRVAAPGKPERHYAIVEVLNDDAKEEDKNITHLTLIFPRGIGHSHAQRISRLVQNVASDSNISEGGFEMTEGSIWDDGPKKWSETAMEFVFGYLKDREKFKNAKTETV